MSLQSTFLPHGKAVAYDFNDMKPYSSEFRNKLENQYQNEIKNTNLDLYQHFLHTEAYNRADLQEKVQIAEMLYPPLVIPDNRHLQNRPLVPFSNVN